MKHFGIKPPLRLAAKNYMLLNPFRLSNTANQRNISEHFSMKEKLDQIQYILQKRINHERNHNKSRR